MEELKRKKEEMESTMAKDAEKLSTEERAKMIEQHEARLRQLEQDELSKKAAMDRCAVRCRPPTAPSPTGAFFATPRTQSCGLAAPALAPGRPPDTAEISRVRRGGRADSGDGGSDLEAKLARRRKKKQEQLDAIKAREAETGLAKLQSDATSIEQMQRDRKFAALTDMARQVRKGAAFAGGGGRRKNPPPPMSFISNASPEPAAPQCMLARRDGRAPAAGGETGVGLLARPGRIRGPRRVEGRAEGGKIRTRGLAVELNLSLERGEGASSDAPRMHARHFASGAGSPTAVSHGAY